MKPDTSSQAVQSRSARHELAELESQLRSKCATIVELSQTEPLLHCPTPGADADVQLSALYETETYFENRLAYAAFCGYSTDKLWRLVADLDTLIHAYQRALAGESPFDRDQAQA